MLPEDLSTIPEKYQEMYKPEQEKEAVLQYFDQLIQTRINDFELAATEMASQVQAQTPNNPDVINLFD